MPVKPTEPVPFQTHFKYPRSLVATHAQFIKTDKKFLKACANAGIPPTKAQARKWRQKRGLAWKVKTGEIRGPTPHGG